jgi:hypothetical protein
MAEAATLSNGESSTPGPKYHAPKDRKCKFCGVSFTSSSLGRHLDQFIKEKNPKVPDNIHHVDEIKKMREGITRRQPRNSMLGRRGSTLTPVSTPRAPSSAKEAEPLKPTAASSIPKGKEGQYAVDSILSKFPLTQGWEQTDVMTETPKTLDTGAGGAQGASRRANNQRRVSRQVLQKAQFDDRHKLEDAMDIARAAELSLRELLEAWRAAKCGAHLFDRNDVKSDIAAGNTLTARPSHSTSTPSSSTSLHSLYNAFDRHRRSSR